jgi:hypothetical protein
LPSRSCSPDDLEGVSKIKERRGIYAKESSLYVNIR